MIRALGALAALAAIVAVAALLAPASLLADRVERAAAGRLRLANPAGSLWNGSADAVFANGRVTLPLAWRMAPWPLARGEARVALARPQAGPGVRGDVVATRDLLTLRDVDVLVSAAALQLPAGVAAGGEIRIATDAASIGPDRAEGRVQIVWSAARLALPGIAPSALGEVTATLTADGQHWRGPLTARGGMLRIDGEVIADARGADLVLAIVPSAEAPAALRQSLGPLDAEGVARVRLTPRFR